MEFNEEDGHWRVTVDIHDGEIHLFHLFISFRCNVSALYTAIDHDYWFLHSSKDHVWSWAPEWNNEKYEKKYKIWPARKYITESILPNSALKDVIDARQRGYRNITDLVNHQSNHDYDRLLVDLG
ncbi:unnamed protein product [Rotaria socialis]|uniref:Uncharacterized protein n=1 Tax=Rotaria socialis TaxID=392032 RepID=A0A817SNH4_9BILA|nr:unnamed protein product [Rotaria socialis]CAF3297962.1 unnamed protein product [Rotaria socialis]CAF3446997.1 unnamed protein product [Rotaria socialis]CAF3479728.1 unnamed protein product [Rotaria socialis]CAF4504068.1 unnamed protein product [Rotaria socialis]